MAQYIPVAIRQCNDVSVNIRPSWQAHCGPFGDNKQTFSQPPLLWMQGLLTSASGVIHVVLLVAVAVLQLLVVTLVVVLIVVLIVVVVVSVAAACLHYYTLSRQ